MMRSEPERVKRVVELPTDIATLAEIATAEGWAHLERLVADWHAGTNRFNRPGEGLFEARAAEGSLIGLCGLNRDPHAAAGESAGRVRRMYVLPAWRGRGVGSQLLAHVEQAAGATFTMLVLRTHDPAAAAFYAAHGFAPVQDNAHRTHAKALAPARGGAST